MANQLKNMEKERETLGGTMFKNVHGQTGLRVVRMESQIDKIIQHALETLLT